MGRFDDYNTRMVDREHDLRLNPIDEEEPECKCSCCDSEAEFDICGSFFCESCAVQTYRKFPNETAYCDICSSEEDTIYQVGDERYCLDCFKEVFRL